MMIILVISKNVFDELSVPKYVIYVHIIRLINNAEENIFLINRLWPRLKPDLWINQTIPQECVCYRVEAG